jgi:hypothetical protein
MTLGQGTRARRPTKRHGEDLRLVLERLAASLAPAARALGNALTSRTGVAFTGAALLVGGAIWGAIVRAAPCKGGGEPSPLGGAFFGAFGVLCAFGWWAMPAGASVGAAPSALRFLRQKQPGARQREAGAGTGCNGIE